MRFGPQEKIEPDLWSVPTQKGEKQCYFACTYLLTPMESVQTDSTIKFATPENPYGDGQTKKYHPRKKIGFTEFSLSISQSSYHHYNLDIYLLSKVRHFRQKFDIFAKFDILVNFDILESSTFSFVLETRNEKFDILVSNLPMSICSHYNQLFIIKDMFLKMQVRT